MRKLLFGKADLYGNMEKRVKRYVKHYKSDFYEYDMPRIRDLEDGAYLWIVRENGTFMLTAGAPYTSEHFRAILENFSSDKLHFYSIVKNADGIYFGSVSENTARKLSTMEGLS